MNERSNTTYSRQQFIEATDIPAREIELFVQSVDQKTPAISMSHSNTLVSATIESEIPSLGRLEMKKLTLTYLGDADLLGREIEVSASVGVRDDNDIIANHTTIGRFHIVSSEQIKDKDQTKVVGYDQTHKLTEEYKPAIFTYPTTAQGLAEQIAAATGIELATAGVGIDIAIDSDLYANIHGLQYRQIIEEIAALTASVARFDLQGKLEFWRANDDESEVDEQHHITVPDGTLLKLTEQEKYGEVNSLVLARSPQNDNVAKTEPNASPIIEAQIVNNQIIDKRREAVIDQLYPYYKGLHYHPFEAETSGLVTALVGDIVRINGRRSIIMGRKLTIDGGIKERIWCKDPRRTKINYGHTSSIDKRIKNTELYVDKQEQVIRGIVSDVQTLGGTVNDNHTEITQRVDEITQKIQRAGGANMLRNSAFFYEDTNEPDPNETRQSKRYKPWATDTANGIVPRPDRAYIKVAPSPEALANGSLSGMAIHMKGKTINQRVLARPSRDAELEEQRDYYTISMLIKKGNLGSVGIFISEDNPPYNSQSTLASKVIGEGEEMLYDRVELPPFFCRLGAFEVTIAARGDGETIISDIMLVRGRNAANWEQANGEAMNTSVIANEHGLIVKSDIYDGAYTAVTPLEFAGYAKVGGSQQRVFTVNGERTEVAKLKARDEITLDPIKAVAINTGSIKGVAFISSGVE